VFYLFLNTVGAEGSNLRCGGLEVSQLSLLHHLGGNERVGGCGRCGHGHVLGDGGGALHDGGGCHNDGGNDNGGLTDNGLCVLDVTCAHLSHVSDLSVDGGCLNDLLVYGLCVLDDSRDKHITLQDGLDLFDDGLSDDFLDDGCVDLLSAQSGVTGGRGEDNVLLDDGSTLDDRCADLGGELSLLDQSGLDLSLVHHLGDLTDIELLSLSVDNGLDLLLLNGVDSLLDDDILLDGLDDGGLSTSDAEAVSSDVGVRARAEGGGLLNVASAQSSVFDQRLGNISLA